MTDPTPTVFIVDDDPAMRESLCWLIGSVGLQTRAFASASSFLGEFDPALPGCLVLDVRMAGMSGLELQSRLAEKGVPLPVLLITGHGDVSMAVNAMKNGVFDFFEKPFNDQALLERVQQAIEVDAKRRQHRRQHAEVQHRMRSLTPREKQVLDMVVNGRLNKQIAVDLNLSEKTIETHRANLMRKMGAATVVDLVRMVMESEALVEGPGGI